MRKSVLALATTLALVLAAGVLAPAGVAAAAEPGPSETKEYIEVVEELTWDPEKTETAGFGTLHKNLDYNGQPIVVNGKTYDRNSLGTHVAPPADADPARDIVYDISAYSEAYPYFTCMVAQPDDGYSGILFTILVERDGAEGQEVVDEIEWRHKDGQDNDTLAPAVMRAYVKGAKTLILRSKGLNRDHSFGSCVFLDVKLLKEETGNTVHAARLLNRGNKEMVSETGFGASLGSVSLAKTIYYDQNIDLTPFGKFESSDNRENIYRVEKDGNSNFDEWISLHLKRIQEGGDDSEEIDSYGIYVEEGKSNPDHYVSIKWDIEDMGFTYFSALGYDGFGWGFHADLWIDGEEAYTSGWISAAYNGNTTKSTGTNMAAPREFGVAIPENAKELELRIIADTKWNNGELRILEPTFFKSGVDRLAHYPAEQKAGSVWEYYSVRGRMWDGQATKYRDCNAENAIKTTDEGFFFVQGTSYTFDLEGVPGNTLVATCGRAPYYEDQAEATPVMFCYESRDAEGEVLFSGKTDGIDWNNSGQEVKFFLGNGAKTLKIWLETENGSFSEAVLADGHFVTRYSVSFDDGEEVRAETYGLNEQISEPQRPVRTGYDFVEWRKKGEDRAFSFEDERVTEDIELVAVWQPQQYAIHYKQQLGSAAATDAAEQYEPATHTYGTPTALPQAAAVEGYRFDGWYVGETKVTELAAEGYTAEIVVTARYSVIVLTVEFYDGEEKLGDKTVNYGNTVNGDGVTVPEKTGYDFSGWQIKTGETATDYSFESEVVENLKLYVKRTPKEFDITYKVKLGGAAAEPATGYSPAKHVYGTATKLPEAKSVEGYVFEGWYVGETKVTELAAEGYVADITVTARYRVTTVSVTFVTGTGEPEVLDYDIGATVGDKTPEAREGYRFGGWYLDEECTAAYDTSSAIESALTLYAKWDAADSETSGESGEEGGSDVVVPVVASVAAAAVASAGVALTVVLVRKRKLKK